MCDAHPKTFLLKAYGKKYQQPQMKNRQKFQPL
jgi:hypothetical protein